MTSAEATDQSEIDRRNREFWDELCGTRSAASLGITDDSPESVAKFDAWYFRFYPWLFKHVPFEEMTGKRVLEIGLGYGSVAQKIAAAGARYHGLDIASGPVAMVKKRLSRIGADGVVRQGSVLEPPFETASFEWVVAIGCLHHTGDLVRAIHQVRRLLALGGKASVMVYSALSYRQWVRAPVATWRRKSADPARYQGPSAIGEPMRLAYDASLGHAPAPQTEFVTRAELEYMCRDFRGCAITSENIGGEGPLRLVPRRLACALFGSTLGLDLYCRLET